MTEFLLHVYARTGIYTSDIMENMWHVFNGIYIWTRTPFLANEFLKIEENK